MPDSPDPRLCLEIELLTGVYRGSLPHGLEAEWPPHPERVFSALVQAWADGDQDETEHEALRWLEAQPAPLVEADDPRVVSYRDSPTVFVPPNDDRGDEIRVLPERRSRQARLFRAVVPQIPFIRFYWQAEPTWLIADALDNLASRVASIGHSASLVRAAFVIPSGLDMVRLWHPAELGSPLRVPHAGRMARLEEWFERQERPRSGMALHYKRFGAEPAPPPPAGVFGGPSDWFVFEDDGGWRPDLLATAKITKVLRDALMSLGPQPVPELLSGHDESGGPTSRHHVAILPLARVGDRYGTGDVLGLAVVLPRNAEPNEREKLLTALSKFAQIEQGPDATAELRFGDQRSWLLKRAPAPSRETLRPERWCQTAATWATVTPLLLDRYAKNNDPAEEAATIAQACRNIGLPEPETIEIHKHSAHQGAASAYPARGVPTRPDWSFPTGSRLARRPRRHAVLRFAEPVRGPIIVGAGRFQGFGLCLPLAEAHSRD